MPADLQPSITDPRSRIEPWRRWKWPWLQAVMRLMFTVGNVMAWVILSLFYVAVVTVYGLIFKLLRADPLRMRSRTPGWQPPPSQYDRLEDAKLQ